MGNGPPSPTIAHSWRADRVRRATVHKSSTATDPDGDDTHNLSAESGKIGVKLG